MTTVHDSKASRNNRQVRKHKRRGSVIQHAPELAERDGGYFCHYCDAALLPPGVSQGQEPYYELEMTETYPPECLGDCNGKYSYQEVVTAMDLHMQGLYRRWSIRWAHPNYRNLAVDHKTPVAKGGSNELSNLVLACEECNQKKKAKDYDVFMHQMRGGAA